MKTRFIFRREEAAAPANGNGRAPLLSEARPGDRGTLTGDDELEIPLRLREMGFVPGTRVEVLRQGPLGDPIEIELRGYRICLRRSDVTRLRVHPFDAGPAQLLELPEPE